MSEAWLSGPIEGVPPLLMPAAHALVQVREEMRSAVEGLTQEQLWERPGGVAAVGFHLRHIPGLVDRLLTYARGEQLSDTQLEALRAEKEPRPDATVDELLAGVDAAVDRMIDVLRNTSESDLLKPREVGRKKLPSNVIGLLFHIAEHAARHTGQTIVTARVVRASSAQTAERG